MTKHHSAFGRRPGRLVLAAATVMVALTVSACAGDTTDPSATSEPAGSADATRSVSHTLGSTEISGTPTDVVALEFSFAQALDGFGVTPVGIADDDKPDRIAQLLGKTVDYTSVGTRLEPNLELVSELQPDLIIADETRHAAIYEQLSDIAPTIVLNSWEGGYQEIKDAVVTIGHALGQKSAGEQAVLEHEATMDELAAQVPDGEDRTFMMFVALADNISLHTSSSFTGSVFEALGLTPALESDEATEGDAGLERLVTIDPGVLLVATEGGGTVVDQWRDSSTWNGLTAVQSSQVYEVDRNQYSRFRSLRTAEVIAADILKNVYGVE